MRILSYPACSILLLCLVACFCKNILAAEFVVSTRDDVLALTSKIQATQFLTHATFGATQAEIDQLAMEMRQSGTIAAATAWLDRQMNATLVPPSFHLPREETLINEDLQYLSVTVSPVGTQHVMKQSRPKYRQHAWWHNVITGQDQLRQKTAWALAQIFPVGNESIGTFNSEDLDSGISGPSGPIPVKSKYLGLSNFYDVFVQNAFGRFRDLLGKITYHSIMGDWLSYRGNVRAQNGLFPDENYAREVMQLFSIGLYLLNDDGTVQTNAQGGIPSYDADDIREYAKIFTGLGSGSGTYDPTNTALNPNSPYTGSPAANPVDTIRYQIPLRMAPKTHDRGTKNLLNGLVLTNPNGIDNVHTETSANAEIESALEGLFSHQSCPPFICKLLIQRFVKSNPSRACR